MRSVLGFQLPELPVGDNWPSARPAVQRKNSETDHDQSPVVSGNLPRQGEQSGRSWLTRTAARMTLRRDQTQSAPAISAGYIPLPDSASAPLPVFRWPPSADTAAWPDSDVQQIAHNSPPGLTPAMPQEASAVVQAIPAIPVTQVDPENNQPQPVSKFSSNNPYRFLVGADNAQFRANAAIHAPALSPEAARQKKMEKQAIAEILHDLRRKADEKEIEAIYQRNHDPAVIKARETMQAALEASAEKTRRSAKSAEERRESQKAVFINAVTREFQYSGGREWFIYNFSIELTRMSHGHADALTFSGHADNYRRYLNVVINNGYVSLPIIVTAMVYFKAISPALMRLPYSASHNYMIKHRFLVCMILADKYINEAPLNNVHWNQLHMDGLKANNEYYESNLINVTPSQMRATLEKNYILQSGLRGPGDADLSNASLDELRQHLNKALLDPEKSKAEKKRFVAAKTAIGNARFAPDAALPEMRNQLRYMRGMNREEAEILALIRMNGDFPDSGIQPHMDALVEQAGRVKDMMGIFIAPEEMPDFESVDQTGG